MMNSQGFQSVATATKPRISAIIPVYNEAGKVGLVLETLRQVDRISEIIVVDDGSTDSSAEEIKLAAQSDPRLQLLQKAENRGKGQAIFSAWRATNSPYLLLLDADLFGLKPEHVEKLISPVVTNQVDMSIGQFTNGNWASDFSHWVTPWLSGQRSLRAKLLGQISFIAARGYGFETALTVAAGQYGWRCIRVPMPEVWHFPSEAHRGIWVGGKNRARMYAQIAFAWYHAGGLHRFGLWQRTR
jgi:glycosyltransferase involved in cell wall biosynthesis